MTHDISERIKRESVVVGTVHVKEGRVTGKLATLIDYIEYSKGLLACKGKGLQQIEEYASHLRQADVRMYKAEKEGVVSNERFNEVVQIVDRAIAVNGIYETKHLNTILAYLNVNVGIKIPAEVHAAAMAHSQRVGEGKSEAYYNKDRNMPPKPMSVLDEASNTIHGRGNDDYGKAERCLAQIASQWNLYLYQRYGIMDIDIGAEDVCYMMADLKKVRQMHKHKRDNIVDGLGYLALIDECDSKEDARNG